jgi:transposase
LLCFRYGSTRDFRSIGRAAQEELRRRALVLILQQGLSQAEAAKLVGVQRQTVNIWLRRYRAREPTACSTGGGCRRAAARGC